jgi:hypothetical protein
MPPDRRTGLVVVRPSAYLMLRPRDVSVVEGCGWAPAAEGSATAAKTNAASVVRPGSPRDIGDLPFVVAPES